MGNHIAQSQKSKSAVKTLPLCGDKDHHQRTSQVTRAKSGSFPGLLIVLSKKSNKSVLAKLRVTSRGLENGSIVVKITSNQVHQVTARNPYTEMIKWGQEAG